MSNGHGTAWALALALFLLATLAVTPVLNNAATVMILLVWPMQP